MHCFFITNVNQLSLYRIRSTLKFIEVYIYIFADHLSIVVLT
uniref:Uncharacterized protein n=1 Tax=Anguilla anguilla TaxID=7936 RepID=A0A0E9R9V5_ANGAN